MTQHPSGAMGVSSPLTDSSVGAHEWELSLLKVHHQTESHALSGGDPGPAGFDFVLPDDAPRGRSSGPRFHVAESFDEKWLMNDC
jgi:hypothetical protein